MPEKEEHKGHRELEGPQRQFGFWILGFGLCDSGVKQSKIRSLRRRRMRIWRTNSKMILSLRVLRAVTVSEPLLRVERLCVCLVLSSTDSLFDFQTILVYILQICHTFSRRCALKPVSAQGC